MGDDDKIDISDLLEDTITIGDFSTDYNDAITINLDSSFSGDTNVYTVDTTTSFDTSTITVTDPTWSVNYNEDFVDTMPSVHRVDAMCTEYPALAKAYEKFKSMYKMCEQDYKGKLKAQGLDDEIPF